jgi:DNA methylase
MKRRVRVKPTRTERRQRLARALDETGLGKRGVAIEGEKREEKREAERREEKRETPEKRERKKPAIGHGHGHGHGKQQQGPGHGKQRRALSMPRAPGRIGADGDPRWTGRLVQALREASEDEIVAESLTHPVHAYPARMHPATARVLIEIVMEGAGAGVLVDPFCGSGTTLVEARAAGVRAFGCDLNPLAVRLARAKTWTAPVARRRALREAGRAIAGEVLAAGREARRAGAEPMPLRAPPGFDPNARNRRLARWFAPHVRRELEMIAARIDDVREGNPEVATALEVCLSAVLYKVSSRASDTDPSWVERHVARGQAARLFGQRVDMLCAGLDDLAGAPGAMPEVIEADARGLAKRLGAGAAAGVVTSPPYAGTYDYAEQHRLRFDFLGLRHRALDDGEIGARRRWDEARAAGAPRADVDRRWRDELAAVLDMIEAILAPGRLAALLIGDSLAGGRAMRADDDLRAALPRGLAVAAAAWQERPMLGGAELRAFADRPKREHVLLIARSGPR